MKTSLYVLPFILSLASAYTYTFDDIDEDFVTRLMNERFMPKIEASFQTKLASVDAYMQTVSGTAYGMTDKYGYAYCTATWDGETAFTNTQGMWNIRGDSMTKDETYSSLSITEGTNGNRANWSGNWTVEGGFHETLTMDTTSTGIVSSTCGGVGGTTETHSSTISLNQAAMKGIVEITGYTKINNWAGRSYITELTIHTFEFDAVKAEVDIDADDNLYFTVDAVDGINSAFAALTDALIIFIQQQVDEDLKYATSKLS